MGKYNYTNIPNGELFYKKDGKYYPKKKKSFAELNAQKKKRKDDLGEIKMHTVVDGALVFSGTPVVIGLTQIATGNTRFTRIGNLIKAYSLQIKGILQGNLITDEKLAVRVFIFVDWMNQGVLPLVTDIFVDAVEFNRNQARLPASEKYVRYTCLLDRYYNKSSTGVDIVGTGMIAYDEVFEVYHKIKHKIYFTGSTNDITSQGKGSIFMMISDRNGDNVAKFTSVMKYTDV